MATQKHSVRAPVEIITTNIEEHPAVRAWRALASGSDAAALPRQVELLRRRVKSVVYRLPGVGHAGTDVIAKHCVRDSALAESRVYTVLQDLPVTHPEYYGHVEGELEGFGWLFLGDAAGEVFVPEDPRQRQAATRWLAELHVSSSRTPGASSLPDHGPALYREHLRGALAAIECIHASLEITEAENDLLNDVQGWLEHIASRWEDIEAICAAMPRALVHGDFASRNIRVQRRGVEEVSLLVFDWEVAGWGMPGVDLGGVDLDCYGALVRQCWPALDRAALRRAAVIGQLLRGGLAAVHWDALKYIGNPYHPLDDMLQFRQRMIDALYEMGWKNGTPRRFPSSPPRLLPGELET